MKDILDTLAAHGSLKTMLTLLQESRVAATLKGAGPFTLFAPSDDAFQRVKLDSITGDPDYLRSLLNYHIVPEKCSSGDIACLLELVTQNGTALTVQLEEGQQEIDNAKYVQTDVECSNGVIHVIDNVFLPQFSGWYD